MGGYNDKVVILRVESAAQCPRAAGVVDLPEAGPRGGVPETAGSVGGGGQEEVVGCRPVKVWSEGGGRMIRAGRGHQAVGSTHH